MSHLQLSAAPAPRPANAVPERADGLTPSELEDYGLHTWGGSNIQGFIVYERPVFLFDPRRLKNSTFGAFSYINGFNSCAVYGTEVGRYVSLAEDSVIGPPEHPTDWFTTHAFAVGRPETLPKFYRDPDFARLAPEGNEQKVFAVPGRTRIGHDAYIGAGAFIKRDVNIGNGAMVAAGAVVTKDVPPYAIVAGVPAKVVRYRFSENIIERLLALAWWRYDMAPHKFELDWSDVVRTLDVLEGKLADGTLQLLQPDTFRVSAAQDGFDIEKLTAPLY